jgi:hypothetical protein
MARGISTPFAGLPKFIPTRLATPDKDVLVSCPCGINIVEELNFIGLIIATVIPITKKIVEVYNIIFL